MFTLAGATCACMVLFRMRAVIFTVTGIEAWCGTSLCSLVCVLCLFVFTEVSLIGVAVYESWSQGWKLRQRATCNSLFNQNCYTTFVNHRCECTLCQYPLFISWQRNSHPYLQQHKFTSVVAVFGMFLGFHFILLLAVVSQYLSCADKTQIFPGWCMLFIPCLLFYSVHLLMLPKEEHILLVFLSAL